MKLNTVRLLLLIGTALSAGYALIDPVAHAHYWYAVAAGLVAAVAAHEYATLLRVLTMLAAAGVCVWVMAIEYGVM